MSTNFISLEDAAKRLGVSPEEIVEMRSRGDLFGYRDGASWKFKPEELDRVASELMGDALDEDPTGSSILVSEQEVGTAGSKVGSTIGSDLQLAGDGSDVDSDVALVPDPGTGSDVKLVAGKAAKPPAQKPIKMAKADDDDDELNLNAAEDELGLMGSGIDSDVTAGSNVSLGSALEKAAAGSDSGSDVPISSVSDLGFGSDVLSPSGVAIGSDDNIIKGDSDPSISPGSINIGGSDLEIGEDSDLVLGGGSDLALGTDSGINLMSPSDSGISLEDEPLDLAASGISGLDLAAEGSDVGKSSGVSVKKDEEFQLSPSGVIDTDQDSGSQVIELEDSSEFGDAAVALPAEDGGFGDQGFADAGAGGMAGAAFGASPSTAPVLYGTPEVPYTTSQVVLLLLLLMFMCMSGILMTDVVRNMWAWSGTSDLTSGFTSMILSAIGKK